MELQFTISCLWKYAAHLLQNKRIYLKLRNRCLRPQQLESGQEYKHLLRLLFVSCPQCYAFRSKGIMPESSVVKSILAKLQKWWKWIKGWRKLPKNYMECIGLCVHWQLESEYRRIELSERGIKNSFNDFHPMAAAIGNSTISTPLCSRWIGIWIWKSSAPEWEAALRWFICSLIGLCLSSDYD